jgi:uncharacterized membrane protein
VEDRLVRKQAQPERYWQEVVDLDAHAPPFNRTPSAWNQRVPISILASIATIIAGYMALFQWGLIPSVWDPIFGDGTEAVLTSEAAKTMDRWLHVPDGAFGAWGYLSEAILGLAGSTRRWQYRPWMVILFGIDVIPLGGVSAILVLCQGFIIGAWCTPCLITALISFVLVFMAYDEVWASLKYLQRVWQHTHDKGLLWRVFWGYASTEADRLALQR